MAEKAPKPDKIVDALWVGTCEAQMDDGTVLVPGESVVKMPEGEADASDNWQIQGRRKSKADDDNSGSDD